MRIDCEVTEAPMATMLRATMGSGTLVGGARAPEGRRPRRRPMDSKNPILYTVGVPIGPSILAAENLFIGSTAIATLMGVTMKRHASASDSTEPEPKPRLLRELGDSVVAATGRASGIS